MATRVTSTSSVSIPVYAAWRCSKCGAVNFSHGTLKYSESATSTGFSAYRNSEAESKQLLEQKWKQGILDQMRFRADLFKSLSLENNCCDKCNNKEFWSKGTIAYMAHISKLVANKQKVSPYDLPVIGTFDKEIREYAHLLENSTFRRLEIGDFRILEPQETIDLVSSYPNDLLEQQIKEEKPQSKDIFQKVKLFQGHKTSQQTYDERIETVKKLKSLLDDGVITQEEFELKKKELLNL